MLASASGALCWEISGCSLIPIAVSRTTHLSPSTAHHLRTQTHNCNLKSYSSAYICMSVHPFFSLYIETCNADEFPELARRCPHKARIICRQLINNIPLMRRKHEHFICHIARVENGPYRACTVIICGQRSCTHELPTHQNTWKCL